MNGLAVLLCVATLGVQQSWRTTEEGQLEYVLQVEPTFLATLEQGETVTSTLPATAKEVHRFCLRISAGDLKKAVQRTPDLPPLESREERAARRDPDIPVAIVMDSQGRAEQTTDITHGWLATKDGRVQYLVQLAPDLLAKLREGDEIYMNIYPEAGQIQQFVVLAGQEVLPRKAAVAPARATFTAKSPKTIAPVAAEESGANAAAADANPAPGPRLHGPRSAETKKATEPSPKTAEPSRLRSAPPFLITDEKKQPAEEPEQPEEQPLYGPQQPPYGAELPLYGPRVDNREPASAPELFNSNPVEETRPEEQPVEEEAPLYGPAKGPVAYNPARSTAPRTPPAEAPVFDKSQFDNGQFDNGQFAKAPVHKPKANPTSLAPVNDDNHYLPENETRHARSRTSFGAADGNVATTGAEEDRGAIDDNRTAAAETPKRRTSLGSTSTKSSKSTAGDEEPKPWWPLFFTCCALFMSLGGNLYLGWTAAEFYSRYRLAIERMRGGSRESSRDD